MADIDGTTARGFERVKDVFAGNFAEHGEVGASFAAYHHGEKVVDLWGGIADRDTGRAWARDAIVLLFSTTKGLTALCAHVLAERGELDIDAPVSRYWPEFGQAGKEDLPVRYLLSHQAGLTWVDDELTLEQALAWDPVVDALARQKPSWEPGTQHGYHAVTYGWLVGEVVRRVSGRSVGRFFRDVVGDPLALDLWIGLPASEEPRVAPLIQSAGGEGPEAESLLGQLRELHPELDRTLTAPGGAFTDQGVWNSPAVRAAEVPAANAVGDARSLARMYASTIGEVDGVRTIGPEQLARATAPQTSGPNSILLGLDIQFGLGFMLPSTMITAGGPRSFGHYGAGGSVGWADPEAALGFGYAMNRMDIGMAGDQRSARLFAATYEAATARQG